VNCASTCPVHVCSFSNRDQLWLQTEAHTSGSWECLAYGTFSVFLQCCVLRVNDKVQRTALPVMIPHDEVSVCCRNEHPERSVGQLRIARAPLIESINRANGSGLVTAGAVRNIPQNVLLNEFLNVEKNEQKCSKYCPTFRP